MLEISDFVTGPILSDVLNQFVLFDLLYFCLLA